MATTQAESAGSVFVDLWQFWVGGLLAILGAQYFSSHNHLIKFSGEWFYALVFIVAALVFLGYGVFQYYDRTRKL